MNVSVTKVMLIAERGLFHLFQFMLVYQEHQQKLNF